MGCKKVLEKRLMVLKCPEISVRKSMRTLTIVKRMKIRYIYTPVSIFSVHKSLHVIILGRIRTEM